MIELREGNASDREAILSLRTCCFPDDDREKQDPRFWDWEFSRGRVFLAMDGERAVAHLGFSPQTLMIDGGPVSSMLAVDAMTDPDYRRQGLFQRVAALAAARLRESVQLSTAWQIRDAVLPPMTANGWKPLLRASVLVKPVSLRSTPLPMECGGSAAALEEGGAAAVEFLRNVNHGSRDAAFLRWRFTSNRLWPYAIDANADAYVVTRRTTLRGYDTLAIADLGWRPGQSREGRLLLRDAIARGRAAGVQLTAVLMSLGHPALPTLVRSGFLPSPHRFRFLVNVFDERVKLNRAKWGLTWGDTDHL
ncbi:MAG TPA: GNAT family N-acetyltransferase [Thermoanaerobaculia bacterium]|nr:GNAT family N-acetyltransferase [Thermoanaerobaculia bacterium]